MVVDEAVSLSSNFAQLAQASLELRHPNAITTQVLTLGHPPLTSEEEENTPQEIATSLAQLERQVSSLGLFSSNETEDDIATNKIKYLLVPYLEAVALLGCHGDDREERLKCVSRAKELLEMFLGRVDGYGFVKGADGDVLRGEKVDVEGMNPGDRRMMKIERYKREKRVKEKLVGIYGVLKRGDADADEEIMREGLCLVMGSVVRDGLDMLGECEEEKRILEYAVRFQREGREPPKPEPRKPTGIGGLPANFVITDKREQLRSEVFRPSHSLPTYTVEEWGEIEARRMLEASKKQKESEAAKAAVKENEDEDANDNIADRETYKAREWDDWKDEHNKGSGNTLR